MVSRLLLILQGAPYALGEGSAADPCSAFPSEESGSPGLCPRQLQRTTHLLFWIHFHWLCWGAGGRGPAEGREPWGGIELGLDCLGGQGFAGHGPAA